MLCYAMRCLVSCSDLLKEPEDNSTLTLRFNGSGLSSASARNVTAESSETDTIWLAVKISGDYTARKNITLTDLQATYQVEFEDIPVGAIVSVQADVYSQKNSANGLYWYTGNKSNVEIVAGSNDISIAMTDIATVTASDDTIRTGSISFYDDFPGDYPNQRIAFFPHNKYQIRTSDSYGLSVSEGLYEGDLDTEGTIYLTEHVYRQYRSETNGSGSLCLYYIDTSSNPLPIVILDEPKSVAVSYVPGSMSTRVGSCTFTSENGLTYKVQ